MNNIYHKGRLLIRNWFLNIFGFFSKPSSYIHILNGHMVDWNHDDDKDGIRFESRLAELYKYCNFVNIEDAIRMIMNNELVERPTIAFTFDDGWRDCYTQIAPKLEKYGVNAMFFINPNLVDAADSNDEKYIENFTVNITKSPGKRPMTWKQIMELKKRGFLFGAHTLDHYCINDDNIEELEHQIRDCRRVLENKLGVPCDYFAFPYGRLKDANDKSIEIAIKCYKYVFTQSNYKYYFSYNGKLINRRHFEPFWPISHINYFLSKKKRY